MDRAERSLSRKAGLSRPQVIQRVGTGVCAAIAVLAVSVAAGVHPAVQPSRIDREAQHILAAPAADREALDRVAEMTRRSLAARPLDGAANLRLAYLVVATSGRLDSRANDAILRSYVVEPLGSELTLWRLGFVLDNWTTASPQVRQAALRELTAVYPRRSWDFDALARTASDPQGRMVATIATRRLRRELTARTAAPSV